MPAIEREAEQPIEKPTPAGAFVQRKVQEARQAFRDPEKRASRTKRRKIFHKAKDLGEALRTPLVVGIPDVTVDQEGILYLKRWQRAKITPDYEIIGRPQPGRDYSRQPPQTKTPQKQVTAVFPQGLETLLRTAEEIRDKYRLNGQEQEQDNQAWQMNKIRQRRLELEVIIDNWGQLTDEQAVQVVRDNMELLNQAGILKPQNQEKRIMQAVLQKGVTDRLGRKNALAAAMRMYQLTMAILEREEIGIPQTLAKYAKIAEITRLRRDRARTIIKGCINSMEIALRHPSYETGIFENQTRENLEDWARVAYRELRPTFEVLLEYAKERPYVTSVRKAVELFGTHGRIKIPEGTVARRVQQKRTEPTITDWLSRGKFQEAAGLVRRVQRILQTTLDAHKDYKTIKRSEDISKKPTERFQAYMAAKRQQQQAR